MVGPLFALVFAFLLVALARSAERGRQSSHILAIVLVGYLVRLGLQAFIRDANFFSHDPGGDSSSYEAMAVDIARHWQVQGISFFTGDDLPVLGPAVLPQNLFAAVVYLNGGEPTRIGCTALIALAMGVTCINLYELAVQLGADPRIARNTLALFYLGPTCLHYTGDTFKDGLVICFVVAALASGVRLMQRFSVLHLAIAAVSLWALWFVRFYLVFVTAAPLVVGLLGVRSKSVVRPVVASLVLVGVAMALLTLSDVTQRVSENAAVTFQERTSAGVRDASATGGSGVTFDDGGSPFGKLWLKLIYTLFAPFPWASGSFAFHVCKIDVFIMVFFVVRAWAVLRTRELRLVALMMLTFAVPCTVMYATSMANVGLIARQRLVIVAAFAFLASLYRPAPQSQTASNEVGLQPHLARSRA
jgi:hypothetical protein